jgi:hypothetical protein
MDYFTSEVVFPKIRYNSLHLGIWTRKYCPKKRFHLMPPLLNGMYIAFGRATFIARAFSNKSRYGIGGAQRYYHIVKGASTHREMYRLSRPGRQAP